MSKRRRSAKVKGIVAGVAGAALLLSGSTFALWSDQASVPGGEIMAGNLAISPVYMNAQYQNVSYTNSNNETVKGWPLVPFDASADRKDTSNVLAGWGTGTTAGATNCFGDQTGTDALKGHQIALTYEGTDAAKAFGGPTGNEWHAVPDDTVALAACFDVTLQGDNLVANLNVNTGDSSFWQQEEKLFANPTSDATKEGWDAGTDENGVEHAATGTAGDTSSQGNFLNIGGTDGSWINGQIYVNGVAADAAQMPTMQDLLSGKSIHVATLEAPSENNGKDDSAADSSIIKLPSTTVPVGVIIEMHFGDVWGRSLAGQTLVNFGNGLTVSLAQTRKAGVGNFQ
jgi:predicted ribosomally synthesized peptide with SipW-like signal peptide